MEEPPRSQSSSYQLDEDLTPSNAPVIPERRLMVAVLRRAIWDFALYRDAEEGSESNKLAVDAAGWIFWDGEETVDAEGRYTFVHVCNMLGFDVRELREATLKLTRKQLGKINKVAGI